MRTITLPSFSLLTEWIYQAVRGKSGFLVSRLSVLCNVAFINSLLDTCELLALVVSQAQSLRKGLFTWPQKAPVHVIITVAAFQVEHRDLPSVLHHCISVSRRGIHLMHH